MATDVPLDSFDRIRPARQERSRRALLAALDAFDELLQERPLARVSMDDVARRSGLAITSVYARFDGKAALVLALHERTIASALDLFDTALEDPSMADAPVADVVQQVVESALRFSSERTHVFRAVLAAADDETNQRAAAFIRAGSERVARALIAHLPGDPADAERNVDFAWRSFIAVLQQRWVLWGAEPSRFDVDDEELAERLTHAFLAAIGNP